MAARPGACGVILRPRSPTVEVACDAPSRSVAKRRGIIGLSGIDTRALTSLIRQNGMPNGVIAHAPEGKFDLTALKKERASGPASSAWTSCRW